MKYKVMKKMKPTRAAIRSELKESWTPDFFTVSEEMQGWTIKIWGMVENEMANNTKQSSVQILASENFKRNSIDDQQSKNIWSFFHSFSHLFFYSSGSILTKNQIIRVFDKWNHFLRSREYSKTWKNLECVFS